MKIKAIVTLATSAWLAFTGAAVAQDLGPQITRLGEGIYVYVGKNFNSNTGIVVTNEGVVLIDSGHNPTDSRAVSPR